MGEGGGGVAIGIVFCLPISSLTEVSLNEPSKPPEATTLVFKREQRSALRPTARETTEPVLGRRTRLNPSRMCLFLRPGQKEDESPSAKSAAEKPWPYIVYQYYVILRYTFEACTHLPFILDAVRSSLGHPRLISHILPLRRRSSASDDHVRRGLLAGVDHVRTSLLATVDHLRERLLTTVCHLRGRLLTTVDNLRKRLLTIVFRVDVGLLASSAGPCCPARLLRTPTTWYRHPTSDRGFLRLKLGDFMAQMPCLMEVLGLGNVQFFLRGLELLLKIE